MCRYVCERLLNESVCVCAYECVRLLNGVTGGYGRESEHMSKPQTHTHAQTYGLRFCADLRTLPEPILGFAGITFWRPEDIEFMGEMITFCTSTRVCVCVCVCVCV